MDAYEANPTKVETDLLQHNVITENMSGETQAVQVSAKEKTGLDDLAEAISNQAELMELKANPTRNADGLVIESKIEKGRGSVATLLVKRGTLKRGQIVVAGEYWGKVKALMDERNAQLKEAGRPRLSKLWVLTARRLRVSLLLLLKQNSARAS